MQALEFRKFGSPSELEVVERPDLVATQATAVIRVEAASINPSDVKNVAGEMEGTTLPRVPGRDFAGVVVDGPSDWLGVPVWGTGGDIGFTRDGSHASQILAPVESLARKPGNLSSEQAASIGVNFVIAWLGAVTYGDIRSGEAIVVVGAGGGVGGAVAQIAKARGLYVIGVDLSAPQPGSPVASRLDAFVSSAVPDWPQKVSTLRNGRGADIVFDSVGGIMFEPSLQSLAHFGRLIVISATGKRRVEFDAIDLYHKELRIIGADSRQLDITASARVLEGLAPGFEQSQYEPPVIAARYPLQQAREAYTAVERGIRGKVVLAPNAD